MNHITLAKQARAEASKYAAILSAELIEKLELAHIAQWLDMQDHSIRAKAADTACGAIDLLRITGPCADQRPSSDSAERTDAEQSATTPRG